MTPKLSEEEVASLRLILMSPTFRKATEESINKIWRKNRGVHTLEAAAMAHSHQSGASDFIDALYDLAEIQERPAAPTRKLRHT
jgi:hypothetical protein